ncbi:hypothetical protein ACJJTC_000312 [Scirpophaga incertulas]
MGRSGLYRDVGSGNEYKLNSMPPDATQRSAMQTQQDQSIILPPDVCAEALLTFTPLSPTQLEWALVRRSHHEFSIPTKLVDNYNVTRAGKKAQSLEGLIFQCCDSMTVSIDESFPGNPTARKLGGAYEEIAVHPMTRALYEDRAHLREGPMYTRIHGGMVAITLHRALSSLTDRVGTRPKAMERTLY